MERMDKGDLLHIGTTYVEVYTFKGNDYVTVRDFSTTTNALSKEILELEEENKKLKKECEENDYLVEDNARWMKQCEEKTMEIKKLKSDLEECECGMHFENDEVGYRKREYKRLKKWIKDHCKGYGNLFPEDEMKRQWKKADKKRKQSDLFYNFYNKKTMKKNTLIMDLPPIDYTSTEDRAILRGKYMGEEILIQYYGQTGHPCAYLKVKKIPEDIEMLDVPCNGGITFNNEITEDTKWNGGRFTEGFWIGWDYAHCDDYMRILGRGKKWATEEILKEVENVILWCKKMGML